VNAGCGEPTNLIRKTNSKCGYVKGEYYPYKHGHRLAELKSKEVKWAVNEETGCWEWLLYINDDGYGEIRVGSRSSYPAHRYVYELCKGPIPEGLPLDHTCVNRKCVNPAHLEPVTNAVNAARTFERGRVARKLTALELFQIRELYASGEWAQVMLAARFNIHQSHVSRIIRGEVKSCPA
jgi:hypothetical protein